MQVENTGQRHDGGRRDLRLMSTGTQRKRHPHSLRWVTLDPDEATTNLLATPFGVSNKTVRRDHAGLPDLRVAIEENVCRPGLKTCSLSRESIVKLLMPLRMRYRGSAAYNSAGRNINAKQTTPPDPSGNLNASITLTSRKKIKTDIFRFGTATEIIAPNRTKPKSLKNSNKAPPNARLHLNARQVRRTEHHLHRSACHYPNLKTIQ